MNKSEATTATKNGALAASFSAAMAVVMLLIAMSSGAEGNLSQFNEPLVLIDVSLILVCAFGVYKNSRVASIIVFFYFLIDRFITSTPSNIDFVIGPVFLYFYAKAVQGSFVYHKLEKLENPDYRAANKWTYIIGVPFVLFVASILCYGVMISIGVFPPRKVLAKDEIRTKYISTLISHGIISDTDSVEYFYSTGVFSILDGGYILTQDRVIFYAPNDGEKLQFYGIPVSDIADVELVTQGDTFNKSLYKINTEDPEDWALLGLPTDEKGDQKFVEALRSKLTR